MHTPYFHVALLVPHLEPAMAEIGPALRLQWRPISENRVLLTSSDGSTHDVLKRSVCSVGGPPALELLEAIPGTNDEGDGTISFHHFGVWVEDLPGEVARLDAHGWPLRVAALDSSGVPTRVALHDTPHDFCVELLDTSFDRPWLRDLFPSDPVP